MHSNANTFSIMSLISLSSLLINTVKLCVCVCACVRVCVFSPAMHLLGLNWRLRDTETHAFENGRSRAVPTPTAAVLTLTSPDRGMENGQSDNGSPHIAQTMQQHEGEIISEYC